MIDARDVTYTVAGRALIADVTVTFAPRQLHLIIGPNGAGKSTLIKVLARLLAPAHGRVRYGEVDIAHQSEASLARHRAVLSQAIELAFPLTVREVVTMGRYPHFGGQPGPHDLAIVDEVMRYFDVDDMAGRSYPTLSGGEKQRVNFARVLAQVWTPQPALARVLFLDEPLTFLDIGHQLDFMRKVRTFAAAPDAVVVGVVHDLNLAARFADRLVLLDGGRVRAAGTRDEVMTSANIRAAFAVDTTTVTTADGASHLLFG
jgi:iron complex transport system ATP-binding protein